MPLVKLALNQIEVDVDLQCREKQDVDTIADYAAAYKSGAKMPPIVVFNDGKKRWLADGFHRHPAAKKAEIKHLTVDERKGTKRDALLFAIGANSEHGLRRTNADKRRAVVAILSDAEWCTWPTSEIARRCQVTHPFVLSVRKELKPVTVTGSERHATNEKKIGGGSKVDSAPPDDSRTSVFAAPAADSIPDDAFEELTQAQEAAQDDVRLSALKAAHKKHDATRVIIADIQKVIGAWESIDQDSHPYVSQQAVTAYLKNAVADIRHGQPHAVCPYCKGQQCPACKETGWVTKSVFESAPDKENAITVNMY